MHKNVQALACRATWRVIRADIELAKRQICSKRLHLDDQLSKIYGVQYFFSCITLMMSNKKTSSPQCEQEGPGREIYPGVAYFIVYRPSEACNESKIFSILHNADMEPTVTKLRTQNSASTLFQVLKDHANEAVQNLVRASNTFCFRCTITDMREQDLPAPERPRSYATKACRIVIVNVTEHQTHMTEAHRNLESDGLVAEIVSLPNVIDTTRETNVSDLSQTIKNIDRVMQLRDHASYRGKSTPDQIKPI